MAAKQNRLGRIGVFTAVVGVTLAFLVYLLNQSGVGVRPGAESYRIDAVLPDAGAQLVEGARVTMSGVQVGLVKDVQRRGRGAVVELEIEDDSVTPVSADTRAQLRARTPLGENYIALLPGRSPRALASDAVLPIGQAVESVDVDEVLSLLQGPAREGARQAIQSLGGATAGQGERLNEITGSAAEFLESGSSVVDELYGQRRRLVQLTDQLGDLAAGIGERGDDIRRLARGGTVTFRAIAAQDEQVRSLARVLPSTLDQVRSTTAKLAAATDAAAPVLTNVARVLDDARPAARALKPASDELRGVIAGAGSAARPLEGTLGRLRAVSGPAARALPKLRTTLCELNPILRYARPYVADVVQVMTSLGSASNAYDAIGHTIRLAASFNEQSLVGMPPEMQQTAHTLLHAGLLSKVNGFTYNPYPKPGQANALAKDLPAADGPSTLRAQAGYVYPRITADC